MKLYLYTILSLAISINSCSINTISENQVNSPNNKIVVTFSLSEENQPFYNIRYDNTLILQDSRLGLIRSDLDFSTDLTLHSISDIEVIQDEYTMQHGKFSHHVFHIA